MFRGRLFASAFFVLSVVLASASGNDSPPLQQPMPIPQPGDWVEYRVAIPADPLEAELINSPERYISESREATLPFANTSSPPTPDLPRRWRQSVFRIEVAVSSPGKCEGVMTTGKNTYKVDIPLGWLSPRTTESGDSQSPEEVKIETSEVEHMVDGAKITVKTETYNHPITGFTRWTNASVPFGLVRLSTAYLDIVLVGSGNGAQPPFPIANYSIPPEAASRFQE